MAHAAHHTQGVDDLLTVVGADVGDVEDRALGGSASEPIGGLTREMVPGTGAVPAAGADPP